MHCVSDGVTNIKLMYIISWLTYQFMCNCCMITNECELFLSTNNTFWHCNHTISAEVKIDKSLTWWQSKKAKWERRKTNRQQFTQHRIVIISETNMTIVTYGWRNRGWGTGGHVPSCMRQMKLNQLLFSVSVWHYVRCEALQQLKNTSYQLLDIPWHHCYSAYRTIWSDKRYLKMEWVLLHGKLASLEELVCGYSELHNTTMPQTVYHKMVPSSFCNNFVQFWPIYNIWQKCICVNVKHTVLQTAYRTCHLCNYCTLQQEAQLSLRDRTSTLSVEIW